MKNKELFDKTIGILVNAYMKGTLHHGQGCACAIGNMVAFYNNYKIVDDDDSPETKLWGTEKGLTIGSDWVCRLDIGMPEQLKCIKYEFSEITKIEKAFESAKRDPTGYIGLMQVVDVLVDIHKGDETQKLTTKELFPQTIEGHGR